MPTAATSPAENLALTAGGTDAATVGLNALAHQDVHLTVWEAFRSGILSFLDTSSLPLWLISLFAVTAALSFEATGARPTPQRVKAGLVTFFAFAFAFILAAVVGQALMAHDKVTQAIMTMTNQQPTWFHKWFPTEMRLRLVTGMLLGGMGGAIILRGLWEERAANFFNNCIAAIAPYSSGTQEDWPVAAFWALAAGIALGLIWSPESSTLLNITGTMISPEATKTGAWYVLIMASGVASVLFASQTIIWLVLQETAYPEIATMTAWLLVFSGVGVMLRFIGGI